MRQMGGPGAGSSIAPAMTAAGKLGLREDFRSWAASKRALKFGLVPPSALDALQQIVRNSGQPPCEAVVPFFGDRVS